MKLNAREIYPAPGLSLIAADDLAELRRLSAEMNSAEELFACANACIYRGYFELAEGLYRRALKLDDCPPEVSCNLGALLRSSGNYQESLAMLSRSLRKNPELALGRLQLGYLQREMGNSDKALSSMLKVVAADSQCVGALVTAGEICEGKGQKKKAERFFLRALAVRDNVEEARRGLARIMFRQVLVVFARNEWKRGLLLWHEIYRRYPETLRQDAFIVSETAQLVESLRKSGLVQQQKEKIVQAYAVRKTVTPAQYCEFFQRYFFSLGLMPDNFEMLGELEKTKEYWSEQISLLGEHPYARYRLAIIAIYETEFERAERYLSTCLEKLPPAKARALGVEEILSLLRGLMRAQKSAGEAVEADQSASESWHEAGFTAELEIRLWQQGGFSPLEARVWVDEGFAAKPAVSWRDAGFLPTVAARWREVCGAEKASRLRLAGLMPEEGEEWLKFFPEDETAIMQYLHLGICDPEEASAWSRVFMFAWEAVNWRQMGFTAEEAQEYRSRGVSDPFLARKP